MSDALTSRTSTTLLGRLRQDPQDQAAWAAFVARYGPQIHGWCRRWGLQEVDAQDVTQNVLVTLVRTMGTFTYDPSRSFRGWLKTVTHHAWGRFAAGRQRAGHGSGDSQVGELLHSLEARDDLAARLDREFDRELLEEAAARVRLRVELHTWEAFRLTAQEGLPGAAAAEQLGLPVTTVYKARSKVQKMLQEELQKLGAGAE